MLQELWEASCWHGAGRGHSWAQRHTNNGQCYVKPPENQPIVSVVGLSGLLPTFVSNEHYLARAGKYGFPFIVCIQQRCSSVRGRNGALSESLGGSNTMSPCPGNLGNAALGHTVPCILQPGLSLTPATALGPVVAGAGEPPEKCRGHWTRCQSTASFCSLKRAKNGQGAGDSLLQYQLSGNCRSTTRLRQTRWSLGLWRRR